MRQLIVRGSGLLKPTGFTGILSDQYREISDGSDLPLRRGARSMSSSANLEPFCGQSG